LELMRRQFARESQLAAFPQATRAPLPDVTGLPRLRELWILRLWCDETLKMPD
jgi:hypothetical protein